MRKTVSIPGRPVVLFVDATQNSQGWEYDFSERVFNTMQRRGVQALGAGPYRVSQPEALKEPLASPDEFNCLLLLAHGSSAGGAAGADMEACWEWLAKQGQLPPRLFAACICHGHDPALTHRILTSPSLAPIALAPVAEPTPRQAAAFFVKFFQELNLHCTSSINGLMAQFAFAKAQKFAPGKMKICY